MIAELYQSFKYATTSFLATTFGNKISASVPRLTGRNPSGAYEGARSTRDTKGWILSFFEGADKEILGDLPLLRIRCRDLSRNNPIGRGAIRVLDNNVVGTGLKLQSRVNRKLLGITDEAARDWEEETESRFRAWAETEICDVEREKNFYDQQRVAYSNKNQSGDSFALLKFAPVDGTTRLQVKLVEADNVKSPNGQFQTLENGREIRDGVELSESGRRLAYWIARTAFSQPVRTRAFGQNANRRNVIHLFSKERIGQTRGVPMLSPVVTRLKNLDRYTKAELQAAVAASTIALFIKNNKRGFENTAKTLAQQVTSDNPKQDAFDYHVQGGGIYKLREGEEIQTFNPGRPNDKFEPFVNHTIREIGMAFGIPYEILRMNFEASFSASRGSKIEFIKTLLVERNVIMAQQFCQRIYNEWLWLEVMTGRIKAPGFGESHEKTYAWSRALWVGDSTGHIDPFKEVMAAKLRVDEGFSTREAEALQLTGSSYLENIDRLRKENIEKKEVAIEEEARSAGIDPQLLSYAIAEGNRYE